ncbi:hypothetical protein PO909_032610 [Leuciscus waleckii]
MDILIKALHGRGHSIDVIRTYNSWFVKENSTYYNSITIPNTKGMDEEFVEDMLCKLIDHEKGKRYWLSAVRLSLDMVSDMYEMHKMICQLITNMFESEEIMKVLHEKQYDLMLTDPAWGAGILLAHELKLPMVYNVRWTTTGEGHFDIAPSPMSYIPFTGSGNTGKMNFFQRVKNVFYYFLMAFQYSYFNLPQYQTLCDKYFHPPVRFYELLQGADIWLMRVDFVFEFPRPTMPNIIYIGGFQCKPAKTLPHDLENFVIWRYTGKRPSTLGNNTLLVDWMPQNDLLGHPKTKVFVAHGGTNGVQEALYHGIPVVGIPFFFDQYDNLLRLQERGGAKIVSIATLDKNTLHAAIKERLSHLHRDKPVKPLDSALFWIEFVMRHKGVAHLRTESYKLPWYSYYSVDVAVTFFAVVLIFTLFIFLTIRFVCGKCCSRKRKTE